MDVTCERCNTEYEFDDALVSERGTTVKCTTCGHQFKVRRADGATGPERWVVRTVDGRELEFKALRELQGAIAHAVVTREDVLSRGGARPRRLGSIAELDPFFAGAGAMGVSVPAPGFASNTPPPSRTRTPTPPGMGATPQPAMSSTAPPRFEGSVAIPLPIGPLRGSNESTGMPPIVARHPSTLRPGALDPPRAVPPPPPRVSSVPPPMPAAPPHAAPAAPPAHASAATLPLATPHAALPLAAALASASESEPVAPTIPAYQPPPQVLERVPTMPAVSYARPPVVTERPPNGMAVPPPPQVEVPRSTMRDPYPSSDSGVASPHLSRPSFPPLTPTPSDVRASFTSDDGYAEPRFSSVLPSKRTGGARLIVGLVVAGLFAFAAVTVGREYLGTTPPVASAQADDARVSAFVHEGEASLLAGDIETANEKLVKASALAENDPRVAAELARIAAVRADVAWMRTKLLPPDDPDLDLAKKALAQVAERASSAAERAATLAPNDATTTLLRINALRALGKTDEARKLVPTIGGSSSQPESALTRAALDLGEEQPDWSTVIDRLRAAATAEQDLGRARSMLVYALARSGDVAGAKGELDRLNAVRAHALGAALRGFIAAIERAAPASSASPSSAPVKPVAEPPRAAPFNPPRETFVPAEPPSHVPDDHVVPGAGAIDVSDLPGFAPPPAPPAPAETAAPAPAQTAPPAPAETAPPPPKAPEIDTSDLPGVTPTP